MCHEALKHVGVKRVGYTNRDGKIENMTLWCIQNNWLFIKMLEYIKYQQKQLEKKRRRAAELEAKKEAARVAKMEAEVRKQEEISAR